MRQQCYMAMIYLNWVVYLGVIAWAGLTGRYFFSFIWAIGFPALLLAYLDLFPRISRWVGYGSVADEPAPAPTDRPDPRPVEVTLYSAVGCPFCPIVQERLEELEGRGGISLRKVDVTLRPGTLSAKGIKAVPVVEAGGERLTGNATSQQLAAMVERVRGAAEAAAL